MTFLNIRYWLVLLVIASGAMFIFGRNQARTVAADGPCIAQAGVPPCRIDPVPSGGSQGLPLGLQRDLYKRVGNVPGGTYTEIGDILPIGSTYTPGYIILL